VLGLKNLFNMNKSREAATKIERMLGGVESYISTFADPLEPSPKETAETNNQGLSFASPPIQIDKNESKKGKPDYDWKHIISYSNQKYYVELVSPANLDSDYMFRSSKTTSNTCMCKTTRTDQDRTL
jgi:hypothetical protein